MPGFFPRTPEKFPATRQVWLLAGLASVTLVTILGLVSLAAVRLVELNRRHGEVEDHLNAFSTSLNMALSEAQRYQMDLLSERRLGAQHWAEMVTQAVGEARRAGDAAAASNSITALELSTAALRTVTDECIAWNDRRETTRVRLLSAKVQSDLGLSELDGEVTSVHGRLNLSNAVKIRHLRSLPAGPEAEMLAREILFARNHDAEVGQIQLEISTLALLCEQMSGEKNIDQLTGYKDNLLAPSLSRLERSCERLATFDPQSAERIDRLIERFERVLFGSGYRVDHSHQSIVPGDDGLYALSRRQIDLDYEQNRLRRACGERRAQVRSDAGNLLLAVGSLQRSAGADAARALNQTWKRMLGLGVLGMVLFIVLAQRIARTLKGHLETIELSNLALGHSEEEARRNAESLRQSEQRAQNSLRELASIKFAIDEHAIIAITDLRGVITHVNEKFCAISQYTKAELIGQNHRLLNAGHHPVEFFKEMYRTIAAGKTWRAEICNRAKEGRLYWVDTTIVPFPGIEGKPIEYIAIRTDITERKRAEAAQAESEIRFRQLAENIHDVFWIVTPDNHQMIYISPAFEAIWGHSCRQLYANPALWLDALHRDDVDRVVQALETKQALGTYDEEYRIVRSDGAVRWIWDRAFPIRDPHGKVVRIVGVARDITEQRLTMEAAKRLAAEAQAASKAKSEFLATMSHELRTPMNGVFGFAGLLMDSPLNETQRQYAAIIRSSGESLLSIINDILDFSRIEANKLLVERIPFDLAGSITAAASLLRLQADDKGLSLEVKIDPDLKFRALADPVRFRQVLLNLLGNALKFTNAGGVTISVEVEAGTPPRSTPSSVAIRVADTGIGIDPAKQKLLFQKFSQADSSTTRRFGGTGLGLAISKSLVELMGGIIGMESRPGVGSVFWFTVPVIAGQEHASDGAGKVHAFATPPAAVVAEPAPRLPWRVLVAEDTLPNQRLAEHLLKKLNCVVDLAADGVQAVQLARQYQYDMVFMDLHMPEMDGCEATRAIRRLETEGGLPGASPGRRLPIVALTASVLEDDRLRCRAAGMDGFLTKPISKPALMRSLQEFLDTPGVHGLETTAAPSSEHSPAPGGDPSPTSAPATPGGGVPTTRGPGRPAFDYARLAARMGEDELLPDLIQAFLDQLPRMLADLDAALLAHDGPAIQRVAHALKGSVGLFYVAGPIEASQTVEFMAREGRLGRIDAAASVLKSELERLRLALEGTLQGRAA